MEGACKNDRKINISNGHEKVEDGTSRGDTTTNLRNFSSRFFLVPTENLENVNYEAPGPTAKKKHRITENDTKTNKSKHRYN